MKILLAIDDSKFSEAATLAVIAQFQPQGTEVKVLHVVEILLLAPGPDMHPRFVPAAEELREQRMKLGRELVDRATQQLRAAGFQVTAEVEEADPKMKILDRAAEWNSDLIVVGSHGRRGFERFLLGSVSEIVARHARCSVEIVRRPQNQ